MLQRKIDPTDPSRISPASHGWRGHALRAGRGDAL